MKKIWTYNIEGIGNTDHKSISNVKVLNTTHDMVAIATYNSSINSFSRFIYSFSQVYADNRNTLIDKY